MTEARPKEDARNTERGCINEAQRSHPDGTILKYVVTGILFGIILVNRKSPQDLVSRRCSVSSFFHMYGVIGSAIAVDMLSKLAYQKVYY
jgi:hypothetical protein